MLRQSGSALLLASALLLNACSMGQPVPTAPTGAASATVAPTRAVGQTKPTTTPVAGAPSAGKPTPTAKPMNVYTVERGTVEDILILDGQIAAAQNDMTFSQDGILSALYVQPGETLSKGQLVAELDLGELPSQLREAQLTVQQDQATLNRTAQANKLLVQQAQINVETARGRLEEAKQPATVAQIAQAQAALRQAEANLATTRNTASQAKNQAKLEMEDAIRSRAEVEARLARARAKLAEENTPAAQDAVIQAESDMRQAEARVAKAVVDWDTARNNEVAAVQNAEAQVELARAALADLQRGPDQFKIAEQEREVRRAQVALEQARQQAAPDPSVVKMIESGRLRIAQIQEQIAKRRLYAPFGGEVAVINDGVGSPVRSGQPVLTVVDRSRMELLASYEAGTDARITPPRINRGQPVEIIFSRYPGQTFAGTISQTPSGADTSGQVREASYHINFDQKGQSFALGDLGKIRLTLGRKYDTLWLPPTAINTSRDRSFVFLQTTGEPRRVDVVLGITSADKIEILSGVQAGDKVLSEK